MLDTRCSILDIGCWAGNWILDAGYWILDVSVNLEGVYFELSLNQ
jgi:hypothetical protein